MIESIAHPYIADALGMGYLFGGLFQIVAIPTLAFLLDGVLHHALIKRGSAKNNLPYM
ncbi:MAG: hypothetical protein PHN71_06110 [Candidatus Cloacimonetes bacterium]|nr:hypothetical protein [Candidatus Cloacimonadota bacterium]MDD2210885.1 hypothetical protein [Candidatus Cloacimonadota bacterium]MDD4687304.1 hypothetical protein [Candidatus Cloacimonadota bacterium]